MERTIRWVYKDPFDSDAIDYDTVEELLQAHPKFKTFIPERHESLDLVISFRENTSPFVETITINTMKK